MARSMNQKLKILYIIRLLAGTDESHVVTMNDILEELKSHDIPAERKSIYDDMDALRSFGLDVIGRRAHPAGYYLGDRESLKAFLPLPAAGPEEKPVVPENGKEKPIVSAAVTEKPIVSAAVEEKKGGRKEAARPEWMKGKTKIELSCSGELAGRLVEQFGDCVSAKMKESGGKKGGQPMALLRLKAEPGKEFFGWLTGFGCDMKIVSPSSAVREYRKYLKEIRNMYKDE